MTFDKQLLLIRKNDFFSKLSEEEIKELNLVHHFVEAEKGDYIYFDAHHLDKLYFIKDGYIKIGYINEAGEEVILEIISDGDIFGQFSLEPLNLNGEFAQAHKTDVSLCAFQIKDFERILHQKPEMAIAFSQKVGGKLRQTENRIITLLHKDVRTRLMGFLVHTMMLHGEPMGSGGFRMENFLTHEEIARLIGSSRQTITTLLNQLEAEGLLKASRSEIQIPDMAPFRAIMN